MSVAVQIGQRQAPRRTRSAENRAGLEAARSVVEEDEAARAVVPHRDVQVSVAIEIGEGDRIGAGLFLPQQPREGEGGPPIVEVDPVLSGPVAAVGDDDVEGPVAVHVAQAHGGGHFAARTQRPEWPERPLLPRERATGDHLREKSGDREEAGNREQAGGRPKAGCSAPRFV